MRLLAKAGARQIFEEVARQKSPTAQPDGIAWERGASRPHPAAANASSRASPWPLTLQVASSVRCLVAAELQCDSAGSYPVGGHRISQAEGEKWCRSRLIEVGKIAEAVPGLVRAGRPRSQEVVIP